MEFVVFETTHTKKGNTFCTAECHIRPVITSVDNKIFPITSSPRIDLRIAQKIIIKKIKMEEWKCKACKVSMSWHNYDQIASQVIDFKKLKHTGFRCLLIIQRHLNILFIIITNWWVDEDIETCPSWKVNLSY